MRPQFRTVLCRTSSTRWMAAQGKPSCRTAPSAAPAFALPARAAHRQQGRVDRRGRSGRRALCQSGPCQQGDIRINAKGEEKALYTGRHPGHYALQRAGLRNPAAPAPQRNRVGTVDKFQGQEAPIGDLFDGDLKLCQRCAARHGVPVQRATASMSRYQGGALHRAPRGLARHLRGRVQDTAPDAARERVLPVSSSLLIPLLPRDCDARASGAIEPTPTKPRGSFAMNHFPNFGAGWGSTLRPVRIATLSALTCASVRVHLA